MGGKLMYKLYDQNGAVVEGEQYHTVATVSDKAANSLAPEDGKKYWILTVRYIHSLRSPGTQRVMYLFQRQRVVERQDPSLSSSVVSDMFAEAPWRIPESVLAATGPFMQACACDALPEFPTARVLSFDWFIRGPYRPGGDDTVSEEFPDRVYESAVERSLEPVKLLHGASACSICLKKFVAKRNKAVVRTHCSHLFHRECLRLWLNAANSCPHCRRPVVI